MLSLKRQRAARDLNPAPAKLASRSSASPERSTRRRQFFSELALPGDGVRQDKTAYQREEQVVKSNQPTKSISETALTEEELDKVSAGGTNKTPKNSDTPKETISLNFSEIKFTYSSQ